MFGIIIVRTNENIKRWEEFKKDLSYGKLKWTVDPPSRKVNFLDLTIHVDNLGIITTKKVQKKMNLHLYIPPYSAHPSGLFKSIIYSTIRRYWYQNRTWEDLTNIVTQFYRHLLNRGYRPYNIIHTIVTTLNALAT